MGIAVRNETTWWHCRGKSKLSCTVFDKRLQIPCRMQCSNNWLTCSQSVFCRSSMVSYYVKKKCFRAPSRQLYVTTTTELLILLVHIWSSCDSRTKVAFLMVQLGPFRKSINTQESVLNSNVPLYVNQTSQFLTFTEVLKPAKCMKMRYTELSWLTCTVHVWLFFCQC